MSTRILLLCGTERGRLFASRLIELLPGADLTICTFPEEPWEPPFSRAIENLARSHGKRFFLGRNLNRAEIFSEGDYDLLLAVSWRFMVPPEVSVRMRRGAFVFHDSLLPNYRGFSPTVWALVNGESETGVTLFEMAADVDSGRIIDQKPVRIGPDEYISSVMDRVTKAYLVLLEQNIGALLDGSAPRHEQDESAATYVCKRTPADNQISWSDSAQHIFNLIRAVSRPYTGAFTFIQDRRLTIWSADAPSDKRIHAGIIPGRVMERSAGLGATVMAGDRAIFLREVQLEGGEIVTADQILTSTSMRLR